jgi:hypothetical protein
MSFCLCLVALRMEPQVVGYMGIPAAWDALTPISMNPVF